MQFIWHRTASPAVGQIDTCPHSLDILCDTDIEVNYLRFKFFKVATHIFPYIVKASEKEKEFYFV